MFRAGDVPGADREVARLRSGPQGSALIESLAAQVKTALAQRPQALEIYASALKRFPQSRSLAYGNAEALIDAQQPGQALRFVDDLLQITSNDYHLYELRARAYAALGRRLMEHQSLAEAYVRRGNVSAAIDQLQIALGSGDGDFYETSAAEARLKALREQQRADKKPGGRPQQKSS